MDTHHRLKDLHLLPKVRDSLSFLYLEHCRVDQEDKAIAVHDASGVVPVPCAALTTLLLGPGTSITHAAMRTLAECGCVVIWAGEHGVRCYAQGIGETRSARNLYRQVRLWADPAAHLRVVRRLYAMRFPEPLDDGLTLQQIRGHEGARVRAAYAAASREFGVPWDGRSYARDEWRAADVVNRALSAANSCLYGICHAAIVSAGYSPALGFIHVGKQLSFVYDIADLYKTQLTVPIAFRLTAEGAMGIEGRVRRTVRDAIAEQRLLASIMDDLGRVLEARQDTEGDDMLDTDEALPGGLWDETGAVSGGVNWAAEQTD